MHQIILAQSQSQKIQHIILMLCFCIFKITLHYWIIYYIYIDFLIKIG
jgi:hypothetical protein